MKGGSRNTRRIVVGLALSGMLGFAGPGTGEAAKHTPASWRRPITPRYPQRFANQLKHVGWNRDRNWNLIDDAIDWNYGDSDSVDIVVEFNRRVPPDSAALWLSGYGSISYWGALVSCAFVENVSVARLDSLAVNQDVAGIELQFPLRPALDTATRAVQATASEFYKDLTAAHDLGVDGTGVTIAVIDFGVWDKHEALQSAFVAGFDAALHAGDRIAGATEPCLDCATCSDPAVEEGDGCTNPDPDPSMAHGTYMAGYALARPLSGAACRDPEDGTPANECAGMAPGARLIDVKVCAGSCDFGDPGDVMKGIDWVGLNAASWGIRVASISLFDGENHDGTNALCESVNYLASIGVIPVVCLGNAGPLNIGEIEVASPGAASYAITVAASDDLLSVDRAEDGIYEYYLQGPRDDPPGMPGDPMSFKPDLSAPGVDIYTTAYHATDTDRYWHEHGSSVSTAIVSGAAALILQRMPDIDALSMKQLLQSTADNSAITGGWSPIFGKGWLNVAAAVEATARQDVTFSSCTGPAGAMGQPCPLPDPLASWNNHLDITTKWAPQTGVGNEIRASVLNTGADDATALIAFGIYNFGTGTRQFDLLGIQEVTLPKGTSTVVSQAWTPESGAHQCAQVSVHFGNDSEFRNNLTQRNLYVAASEYVLEVENPFMTPALVHVVAGLTPKGWNCIVADPVFEIGATEGSRPVRVSFHAPKGAQPNDRADCDLSVYARVRGGRDSVLVGGVTVQTYVPEPCRLVGQLFGRDGKPVEKATLRFEPYRKPGPKEAAAEPARVTRTDGDGVFSLEVLPAILQRLHVELPGGRWFETELKPPCGVGTLILREEKDSIQVAD